MFFGNRERFGIECAVYSRDRERGYIFVTLCFYANERRIGDWEQGMLLGTAVFYFEHFLTMPSPRQLPGQGTKSDADLLADTHAVMFGDGTRLSIDESIARIPEYEPCVLCPGGGEAFDGELALLVELDASRSRLIWQDYETKIPMHLDLEAGECEEVLQSFVTWAAESAADDLPG